MQVVVRSWQPGDTDGARSVLKEGSFSNVWPSFCIALQRPATLSIALITVSVAIITGAALWGILLLLACIPLLVYLTSLIATAYFFYGPNFVDMKDVEASYFDSADSHFWVAEIQGEIVGTIAVVRKETLEQKADYVARDTNKTSQNQANDSDKNSQDEARGGTGEKHGIDSDKSTTTPIGTHFNCHVRNTVYRGLGDRVHKGVNERTLDTVSAKVAWLRRMAVTSKYRGLGIAKQLVRTAIEFCKQRGYDSIFLITTEVHQPARALYTRLGFVQLAFHPYKYFYGLISVWTYEFELSLQ